MWLTKGEEETNHEYGKSPKERTIEELINSAVIIADKHSGPTSHQVTAWVRDIFKAKLNGHAGTLDPAVTGVLPIALENATKTMPVLSGLDKEYVGVMHLHTEVPEDVLRNVILNKFVGTITQRPPVKSAVARVERERDIYFFDILEVEGRDVLFKVGCEAGTYIRKLCHDIGQALKVGAHMAELRRSKVGNFTEEEAHSLVEIRDAYEFWRENGDEKKLREMLMPVEYALGHVKKVFIKDSAVDAICNGSPLYPNGICRIQKEIVRGETILIMTLKEELIALGIAKMESGEMIKRKTGISVRVDRVLMNRGTYPRWDKA
ncbi:MAG: RNA-guided pseudouridylation complex pseudouridine synthase subunit Cbf5 [Candidatus Aenigmarchaeota archaeon]|nr:RNA-guided pseudouridylation complex pseudouridine synthase subunit Cbf5 [Candidatus Aenigmarchaeota archaeon]